MSLRLLLALGLVIVLASTALAPDPAEATDGPDLKITAGGFTLLPDGRNFATREQPVRFSWRHITKNVGNRTAGGSRTAVGLFDKPKGGEGLFLHELAVPSLRPDKIKDGQTTFGLNNLKLFEYGRYWPNICADVRDAVLERDEANNCGFRPPFYVVPRKLSGSATGAKRISAPGGVVTISWTGTVIFQLRLRNSPLADEGYFDYFPAQGAVTFTYRKNFPPCTWTATATLDAFDSNFFIRIGFGASTYRMTAEPFGSFRIRGLIKCPNIPPVSFSAPLTGRWLDTGGWRKFQNPGLTRLFGAYINNEVPGVSVRYTWDLKPSG